MKVHRVDIDPEAYSSCIVAGDWHSHYLHEDSYSILIRYAQDKKIKNLIINGDFLDVEYLMAKDDGYNEWKSRVTGLDEFFIPMLEEECSLANEMLDDLQGTFDNIIFLEGNHEDRIRQFRETKYCPYDYRHHFNLSCQLKLEERGIKHIGYNEWLRLYPFKLVITHGMFHNVNYLKSHYETAGTSVICSHMHRDEVKCFTALGDTRKAWSTPAMCTLSPPYLKGRENNWTNGFIKVEFYDHCFWVESKNVIKNRLVDNGTLYEKER